jgi:hypothetical protein
VQVSAILYADPADGDIPRVHAGAARSAWHLRTIAEIFLADIRLGSLWTLVIHDIRVRGLFVSALGWRVTPRSSGGFEEGTAGRSL